jgi:hypothetical protein
MKTLAPLVRSSLYVLLALSLDCGSSGQARDAAGRDSAPPPPQPDAPQAQPDLASDLADARPNVAKDAIDAASDGAVFDGSPSDGTGVADGSNDVEDGGAIMCWYERARTGVALPSFDFSFVSPDRVTHTCSNDPRRDAGLSWPRDLRGVVTSVSATQFTLDTCVGQDACDAGAYTFIVNAPGLSLTIPVGRRVRVQWQISVPWGCISWLQVSDDAAETSSAVWLVGNHGYQKPPFDLPFGVNLDQLACRLPADAQQASCSGALTGDYAFRFSSKLGSASPLSLGTGESGRFTFQDAAGVPQTLDIHCLQALQTVMCDDYWRWSFWAVSTPAAPAPVDAAVDP